MRRRCALAPLDASKRAKGQAEHETELGRTKRRRGERPVQSRQVEGSCGGRRGEGDAPEHGWVARGFHAQDGLASATRRRAQAQTGRPSRTPWCAPPRPHPSVRARRLQAQPRRRGCRPLRTLPMRRPESGERERGRRRLGPPLAAVRLDSSTARSAAARTRASAGTRSAASSKTRLPGTSSSAGVSRKAPPRTTRASRVSASCSASTARSAPASCRNARTALRATMAGIAPASMSCSIRNEIAAAARSKPTSGSVSCRSAIELYAGRRGRVTLFGPKRARCSAASASVRPSRGSLASCRATSSAAAACGAAARTATP